MLIYVKTHLQFIIYTDFAHAFLQAKHIHSSLKLATISLLYKGAIIQSVKSKMIYKEVYYTQWVWTDCQEFQTTWPSLGDLRKKQNKIKHANKNGKHGGTTTWGLLLKKRKTLMKGEV